MGLVLVRDQYSAEHWVEESALPFAPWRDCEVIKRADEPTEQSVLNDDPATATAPGADDKRRPPVAAKSPAQPVKPAAE